MESNGGSFSTVKIIVPLRGCLLMKFDPGMKLSLSIWWNVSYVYTFPVGVIFVPRWIHPCQNDRDENFIPGWKTQKKRCVNTSYRHIFSTLYNFTFNKRFSLKLSFIPGWNSRVNRVFFIPDEISSRLLVNTLLDLYDITTL